MKLDSCLNSLAITVMLILLVSLTACSNSDVEETLSIGLIAPITGEAARVGESTVTAAHLAVNEVNAAGGIKVGNKTYRVRLLIEDNQDSPTQSVHVARKLILQQKITALIGPQLSRNAIPVAQLAEQYQVPMISPWSSNPKTTKNKRFVFRVTPVDDFIGEVMAQFAYETLAIRQAAVLYDIASPYNEGLAEFFRIEFKRLGGTIIAYESYTTDSSDYDSPLQRIKTAQPEALFLPNYGHEVAKQARQAREIGIDAILLGSSTWISIPPKKLAGLDNSYFISDWNPAMLNPKTQHLIEQYQHHYQKPVEDAVSLTYDAFGLLFEAIQSQQSLNATAITDALSDLCYEGVNGLICYQGTGNPVKPVNIMRISKGHIRFYQQIAPPL